MASGRRSAKPARCVSMNGRISVENDGRILAEAGRGRIRPFSIVDRIPMAKDSPIVDGLLVLASPETQRHAARLVQDVFAGAFRISAAPGADAGVPLIGEMERRCHDWCAAGDGDDASAVRLALLVSGLDQWGLAYSQAFGLNAIPALSALIGALRGALDARAEARFQWFFERVEQVEVDAIDFKVALRRSIHLALWHAMAACSNESESRPIVQTLGGMLVALEAQRPQLGWRMVADTLASIQLRLLADTELADIARTSTQQLFGALRQAIPEDRYRAILAHSSQVVVAWQQARRSESA